MAEKHVEAHLKKLVERQGGLCFKFVSPSRRGVCDRICISGSGFTFYVELKSDELASGVAGLSPAQKLFISDLAKRGVTVYVLSSKKEVEQFMTEVYF